MSKLIVSVCAVGALVMLTFSACAGQTRFVVVQSGNAPTTVTSVATAPSSAAPNDADDEAAVRETVTDVFALDDRSFEDRRPLLVGADDLAATYEVVVDFVKDLDVEIVTDEVALNGDDATALVTVNVDGQPFASALPIALQRTDDTWKVTRGGVCAVLALASPCPDASASPEGTEQ